MTETKQPKWYASGRGIFRRDTGFQLMTMPATVNWQEDTARFVETLNRGEEYGPLANMLHRLSDLVLATPSVGPDLVVLANKARSTVSGEPHAEVEALRGECPCRYTTPCNERCTCVMPASSSGCRRCCAYGSPEQQKAMAELLARFIDQGWREHEMVRRGFTRG
jgi:hypothetical protein